MGHATLTSGLVLSQTSGGIEFKKFGGESAQRCKAYGARGVLTRQPDGTDQLREAGVGAQAGTQCTRYASTLQTNVRTLIHPDCHVYPAWASEPVVEFYKSHKHP